MGRTLPWKRGRDGPVSEAAATSAAARLTTSPPAASPPAPKFQLEPSRADGDGNGASSDEDQARGPSSSHPPPPPPVLESFMVPGLRNDDMWRMVEDEFLAAAHKFTAHLHAAEYQRLKELAKDQNADAIRSLSRPVTGAMTDSVKRNQAALQIRRSQAKGLKRALSRTKGVDDEDVDERPWAGTNLQELMDSPRKKPVPLTSVISTVPGTRAAALVRQETAARSRSSPCEQRSHRRVNTTSQTRPLFASRSNSASAQARETSGNDDIDLDSYLPSGRAPTKARANELDKAPVPTTTSRARTSSAAAKREDTIAPSTGFEDDDSDSPVETMFERRMKARRNQSKVPRRKEPSTQYATQDDAKPRSDSGQKSQVPSSLSIPSL